ncbi:MAG: transcription elongation factor GreB [Halobacteriovoraceae bacterium]|nr:transcription elongation factor GreB [Halobacteriovoraceae bacterium]
MSKKEFNYITPNGYKSLIDERDHLTKVERPEVTRLVAWAASLGDRSENADYQYNKKKLREIDRRIRFLNSRLNNAKVIDPIGLTLSTVQFGATVKIIDDESTEKMISIVGVDEINTSKGHISWKSPLGKGLLGKEEGDTIEVSTPQGKREYEILTIVYKEIQ